MNFMILWRLLWLRWIAATTKGLASDITRNALCYQREFIVCIVSGLRILAPSAYIFFATALPVIAFGEQLSRDTDGNLGTVETLISAAMCGIIHYILCGQPFIVPGVSEPTIIMYTYMYKFAIGRQNLGDELYLAWAAWVCTWTAVVLLVMAIASTHAIIKRFTTVAGDAFGMLVCVLFFKQAVKGLVSEFTTPMSEDPRWLYTYGLLAIIFLIGLLVVALKQTSLFGEGRFTGLIPGYGVPMMVMVCIALSLYVPSRTLSSVPQRLSSPLFRASDTLYGWTLIKDMWKVPLLYILAAFIPAILIAGLYFFEHSVASEAARQTDSDPSDHYDILLLGFLTLLCGLMGLPPSSCVLHQSRSLALIRRQLIRNTMVGSINEVKTQMASNSENGVKQTSNSSFLREDDEGEKANSLVTAILLGACIGVIPFIKLIPTSVLWGYFAYMAVDSLPGIQFWERLMLVFTPGQRHKLHGSYVGSVPYGTIVRFTVFQVVYFLVCFGVAWIPIPGILFAVPFFILSAISQHVMPKLFHSLHLCRLDEAQDDHILAGPSPLRVRAMIKIK